MKTNHIIPFFLTLTVLFGGIIVLGVDDMLARVVGVLLIAASAAVVGMAIESREHPAPISDEALLGPKR